MEYQCQYWTGSRWRDCGVGPDERLVAVQEDARAYQADGCSTRILQRPVAEWEVMP